MTELICIVCPNGCHLKVDETNSYSVSGNKCERGEAYGKTEVTDPKRTVTSTVKIKSKLFRRCPVKTDHAIPKERILEAVELLNGITLTPPVLIGQIVLENIFDSNTNFVATRNIDQ